MAPAFGHTIDTTTRRSAKIPVSDVDATKRMPDAVRLQALMVSYQAGDLTAFDQVYVLLAPVIKGFLRRRSLTAATVDDLVQETFLQIHRARHTYDPAFPVIPWAVAIARHVWLMHCRTTSRRPHASESIDDLALGVRADAEAFADQDAVRGALSRLSPARRRPLIWHHILGLSFREIGAMLGIREDAAKLRSSRGMADLRAELVAKGAGRKGRND
jgi:RNA polymerase sigma-70 factor (ECF subfamily)